MAKFLEPLMHLFPATNEKNLEDTFLRASLGIPEERTLRKMQTVNLAELLATQQTDSPGYILVDY